MLGEICTRYPVAQSLTMVLTDSVVAGKGILSSAIATGILGFATTILFLFCTPDLNAVFALNAPQPFVQIYALALGKGGSIFMTFIAVLGLIMVSIFHCQGRKINSADRIQVCPLSRLPGSYSPWPATACYHYPAGSVESRLMGNLRMQ